jgi:(1->4)-alpha-D-glucan 1-alpha-D-glucosylmutase
VFDINWNPLKPELKDKVLLPVLGDAYGAVLERQEIRLEYEHGAFRVSYFDRLFPIAPGTYDRILGIDKDRLLADLGQESEHANEFLSILTAIRHLPSGRSAEPEQIAERDREKEVIKRRLAALTSASARVHTHVADAVRILNGVAGCAPSFDALDRLLGEQAYRLAHWRVAGEEINYRRFFDINELAAIRMEDPCVFELVHAFPFDLIRRGCLDGMRIDHVDGLFDPGDYLRRLRERARTLRADSPTASQPFYLVVEKILTNEEELPEWPVEGTTGYDFLVRVNGLFVDERNERALTSVYERFVRLKVPFDEIAYRGKQLVLRVSMAGELNVLAHRLNQFSERNRHYRDFTLNALTQAMREIIASFPVYRTYVNDRDEVSEQDRRAIEHAVRAAKHRNPNRPAAVYDFVRDLLLKRVDYIPESARDEHLQFVGKFQQVTSPVTAKGVEDTALYLYNRLTSLNEVGGTPDAFGTTPQALHAWLKRRWERWPHALSATSTHDTKRSEDVRARLDVLSELPGAWKQATSRWARVNRRGRSLINHQSYPSRNEEYLLYQTLLGTWPLTTMSPEEETAYRERITDYMLKAMREAKVFTSWLNPSVAHEQAMRRFIETVLSPDNETFRSSFLQLHGDMARYGIYNSLAQLAIKICAPGAPDFYQGSELWDFTLVDPDNRRPVDYGLRRRLLAELDDHCAREGRAAVAGRVLEARDDRLKLFASTMLLRARRQEWQIFLRGDYNPVDVQGSQRDHVFAFARAADDRRVIVAVPRLVATLTPNADVPPIGERTWGDTELVVSGNNGSGTFRNLLTDRCVPAGETGAVRLADAFDCFPIAVLVSR